MKLLLENWKKYLKESEIVSYQQQLGDIETIAQDISDKVQEFMSDHGYDWLRQNTSIVEKEIQDEIRKNFNRDITEAGSGSFRTAYMVDNDYVIKVDSSMNGSGKQMNKEDGEVGRNPKYSSIFPKSLGVAPDGSWVVLQKVHEIQDLMTLIALFPNKIIPPKIFGKFYTQSLLSIALSYQIATLQYNQNQMDFHKYEYESMFKDYLVKDIGRDVTFEEFIKSWISPTFITVAKAVIEYGLDVHEAVRPYNSGYVVEENGEKRFVILDSSVQKTVEAGLKAFNKPIRTI